MQGVAKTLVRSPMFLLAILLVVFSLVTIALAQGVTAVAITLDNIKLAASNPITMAGIIVTAVADVRGWWKNPDGTSKIDGVIMVTVLAAILGGILGTFFQLISWLAVSPFNSWGTPWGGLSYGVVMGVATRIGFNVIDLLINRHASAQAKAQLNAPGGNSTNPPKPSP